MMKISMGIKHLDTIGLGPNEQAIVLGVDSIIVLSFFLNYPPPPLEKRVMGW